MTSRWVPLALLSAAAIGLVAILVSISVGEYEVEEFQIDEVGEVQELVAGIRQLGDRLGPDDVPVAIDVFTDVQSPTSASYQLAVIDPLIEDYARTGEAKLIFRQFPLGGKPLTLGGIAAEAAGLQDRQWQYAELFMRNLDEVPERGVTQDFLDQVASSTPKLDVTQWEQDFEGAEAQDLARADELLATELKLTADPAVVVTGAAGSEELDEAPSLEEIVAAIERVG